MLSILTLLFCIIFISRGVILSIFDPNVNKYLVKGHNITSIYFSTKLATCIIPIKAHKLYKMFTK